MTPSSSARAASSRRASAASRRTCSKRPSCSRRGPGVPAQQALDTGRAADARRRPPSRCRACQAPRPRGRARASCSRARRSWRPCWRSRCGPRRWPTALGARVVERALRLALPLTLALQWGLRSRYLGRPNGLLALRPPPARDRAGRRRASSRCPRRRSGESGALAGLLTLTWTGGTRADPAPLVRGLRRCSSPAATPAMLPARARARCWPRPRR